MPSGLSVGWKDQTTQDQISSNLFFDIPVNLPFKLGITFPTALAAPVELGMMFPEAALPALQSFPPFDEPSTYKHHKGILTVN